MFTPTRCHQKRKVLKNALWQNVHKKAAQVLFDRINYTQNPQAPENLEILEESHYYPFGLQHGNYNTHRAKIDRDEELNNEKSLLDTAPPTVAFENPGYKYKFQGQEHQDEFGLNWDSFKWRNYMPDIGRFFNIDPLAEQYYDNSSYVYTLNNPVFYIDPDGMRVDITELFKSEDGFKTAINTLLDLSEQTGLSLSIKNTGKRFTIEYEKNENGTAVVAESGGLQLGSSEARNHLTSLIDNPNTALVGLKRDNSGSGVYKGSNIIYLDPVQIDSQVDNVSTGLNSKTIGYGMTFLHESYHTRIG